MNRRRTALGAGISVGVLLTLGGCGGASPGVAAEVGDQTISMREVDRATGHICTALGDQLSGNGQVLPMGFVRQAVLQYLTIRAQAEQIAGEYDVSAGADYERDLAQRRATAGTLPEEVREDYTTVMSANAYATSVLDAAGRAALAQEGSADPTVDEVTERGTRIFNEWPESNPIELDPRYGLEVVDGALSPVDTNLSVAVGETARDGLATEPDAAYASTLPASQRCGG